MLVIAIASVESENLAIDCTFSYVTLWGGSQVYSCVVSRVDFSNFDENLTNVTFTGVHLPEHSNIDVRRFFIDNANVPAVVSAIYTNFPNMFHTAIFGGKMKRIQSNAVGASGTLDFFRIHFNHELTTIHSHAFAGASSLRIIDLDNNAIENIHEFSFITLSQLDLLSLRGNNIYTLSLNVFRPLIRLTALFLNGNNLNVLHGDLLTFNNQLFELTIANNRIKAIERSFFEPFINGFLFFGAEGNLCINGNHIFVIATNNTIRSALEPCFENFEAMSKK